jgi:hypothetical protein
MKKFSYLVILLSLVQVVFPQCLSVSNPIDNTQCTKYSDSNNYCCYLTSPGYNPTDRKCIQIAPQNYVGQNVYQYNNLTYNLNCGSVAPYVKEGGACGNSNPVFAADCWFFSTMDNSCCFYYSNNVTGIPGCQWWAGKQSTNTTKPPTYLMLSCDGQFFLVNKFLLVVYFLIFLAYL